MKVAYFLVLVINALGVSGSALAQGLPTQKIVTIELAEEIAHAALAKCRADGYKVTVTVVDSANTPKVILHDDGAPIATIEVGRQKATTVIVLGRPSGPRPGTAPGTGRPPSTSGTTDAVGGYPIKVDDQIIGAVSVAGAPGGDKDSACANAGLAKVKDKLK